MTAELITLFTKIIAEQGVGILLIILGLLFFYYKIWPQWVSQQDQQRKLTDEYRQSTLSEIKELKEDARKDKQLMYEAFMKNVESNIKLQETMADFTSEMGAMKSDLSTVKRDIRTVYILVGANKKLIDPLDE